MPTTQPWLEVISDLGNKVSEIIRDVLALLRKDNPKGV